MLQAIDWRVTYMCNNRCLYCYGNKPIIRIDLGKEKLLLNKIINSPTNMVNITGGEPMLDQERCFYIIRALAQSGKKVYLSTNGTNLANHLDFICENVALLGLPLDGYDSVSNQINGRSFNSFLLVKKILDANKDRKQKVDIKIGTVITKKNLKEEHLIKMCEFLVDKGIKLWRIYEMIPVNRGAVNREMLELTDSDRIELSRIIMGFRELAPKLKIELATRSARDAAYFIIQPDGSVIIPKDSGQNAQEILIGNLLTESFDKVYDKWKTATGMSCNTEYMQLRTDDVLYHTTEN